MHKKNQSWEIQHRNSNNDENNRFTIKLGGLDNDFRMVMAETVVSTPTHLDDSLPVSANALRHPAVHSHLFDTIESQKQSAGSILKPLCPALD